MTTLRTAAQQALEALEKYRHMMFVEAGCRFGEGDYAITALRDALAQPAPEPVAVVGTQADVWRGYNGRWAAPGDPIKMAHMLKDLPLGTFLYTTPPQRKPLSLTDLQEALVFTNLIDCDAIEYPDEYDQGSTLAQIGELHRIIT